MWLCKSDVMSDVMSCDDKGRHYGMQNDRKNRGKMGGFVTLLLSIETEKLEYA
jgi:hypothetical protein